MRIAHKVKQNETVGTIAEQYGVPWRDVLKWNNIEADTLIGKDTPFTVLEINVPDTSPAMEEVELTPSADYWDQFKMTEETLPPPTERELEGQRLTDVMEGVQEPDTILNKVKDYVGYDWDVGPTDDLAAWGATDPDLIVPFAGDVPTPPLDAGMDPVAAVPEVTEGLQIPPKGLTAVPGSLADPEAQTQVGGLDEATLKRKAEGLGETVTTSDLGTPTMQPKISEITGKVVGDPDPKGLLDEPEQPIAKPEEPPKDKVEEETGKTIQASFTADRENARTILSNYPEGLKILDEIRKKDDILLEGYTEMWTTHKGKKEEYTKLAEGLKKEIDGYRTKIEDIAQEKAPPVFEGINKFWAVIAAALGAGAASMTGTPNFALSIINKTIDTELEKFLESREIRKQTAERQQLNLITKRSEYLKQAENAADNAMAALQGRTNVQGQIATIVGLKERIKENRIQNDRTFFVQLTANYMKQRENELAAHRAYGKMYIPGTTMVNSKGEVYEFTAAQGRTDKGVEIMTEQLVQTRIALRALDVMESLFLNPDGSVNKDVLLPEFASKNRMLLAQTAAHMETQYKNAMKMGANYSVKEEFLVGKQVPTMDNFNVRALTTYKTQMDGFRNQIIRVYEENWKHYTSFGQARIGEPQPGRKQPKIPKAAKVRTVRGKP